MCLDHFFGGNAPRHLDFIAARIARKSPESREAVRQVGSWAGDRRMEAAANRATKKLVFEPNGSSLPAGLLAVSISHYTAGLCEHHAPRRANVIVKLRQMWTDV